MLQEAEFLGGEWDIFALNRHFVSGQVHCQFPVLINCLALLPTPVQSSEKGLDACHKGFRAERLGDIVIGTQFESDDLVGFLCLGREHDDREHGGFRSCPETFADFQTVDLRQHEIENNEVRLVLLGTLEPFCASGCRDGPEAFFLEIQFDQLKNIALVFDDENFLGGGAGHGVAPAYGGGQVLSSSQAIEIALFLHAQSVCAETRAPSTCLLRAWKCSIGTDGYSVDGTR